MNLTPQQQAAIYTTARNTVVLACPGSGKTTVLIERIKKLLSDGVHPQSIIAITYTVAAAQEIEQRIGDIEIGFVGTLHSFCLRYLERNAEDIGFTQRLTVIGAELQQLALKQHVINSGAKCSGTEVRLALQEAITGSFEPRPQGAQLVAQSWYASMLENGMLDFDGILYWTIRGLRNGNDNGHPINLLWDEFQDASQSDNQICQLLNCDTRFVIGDDCQSIYGFRGGSPKHLLSFYTSHEWLGLTLDQSQRCPVSVCKAATKLISHSSQNKQRAVNRVGGNYGEISVVEDVNLDASLDRLADQMKQIDHTQSVGVLLRTNFLVNEYATGLAARGIKVAKIELPQFPQDWSKSKLILTAIANPANDWVIARAVAAIMDHNAENLRRQAAASRKTVNEAVKLFPAYSTLEGAIELLRSKAWLSERSFQALEKMAGRMPERSTVTDLLAAIEQMEREAVTKTEGVNVCTMHASKGREWDVVFIPSFADEIVPGKKDAEDIAEERRLVFVAITRARNRLVILLSASQRLNEWNASPIDCQWSRFVAEMGV